MRRAFSLLTTLLAVQTACAALNLNPTVEEYTSQGFLYRKVKFADGDRFVTYVPPQGWEVRGGGSRVSIAPAGKQFAEASITAVQLQAPQAFDDTTVKALEEAVLREAPAGSTMLKLVSEEANPVAIGSYPSYEFVISYQSLGRVFQRSVIYVNTPDTQLIFRCSAPKPDFDVLSRSFRSSLNSWQWTDSKAVVATARAAAAEPKSQ